MAAIAVFACSLFGILALFALTSFEAKRGSRFSPLRRAQMDERALALKGAALKAEAKLQKVPPIVNVSARYAVHRLALRIAAISRDTEKRAHRMADFVSHKRAVSARATSSKISPQAASEFLKKFSTRSDDRA